VNTINVFTVSFQQFHVFLLNNLKKIAMTLNFSRVVVYVEIIAFLKKIIFLPPQSYFYLRFGLPE